MKDLPNIFLVIVDTLRKDTLESNLDSLPNINYLIDRSTYFHNAISPSSWTIPSHASVFSGLYPSEHRMVRSYDDDSFFSAIANFPPRASLIQERLAKIGYNNLSYSANPLVGKDSAFDSSFDFVETVGPFALNEAYGNRMRELIGAPKRAMEDISRDSTILEFVKSMGLTKSIEFINLMAKKWLDLHKIHFPYRKGSEEVFKTFVRNSAEGPFFAFFNLMEMHEPYRNVNMGDYLSIVRGYMKALICGDTPAAAKFSKKILRVRNDLLRNLVAVDKFVGNLISHLKSRNMFLDSVIVLTSDHGQSLGENGYVGHSYFLNDVLVNVPLVVKIKGTSDMLKINT